MIIDNNFISLRLNRAKEAIDEAVLLFQNEHYLTVINRLYYALFYVASAYLAKEGIVAKTHAGTKNQFHQHFIKTGLVNEEIGKLYDELFSERNESDYGDFLVYTHDEAKYYLTQTALHVNNLISGIGKIEIKN